MDSEAAIIDGFCIYSPLC